MITLIFLITGILIFIFGAIMCFVHGYGFQKGSRVIAVYTFLSIFIMSIPANINALTDVEPFGIKAFYGFAKALLYGIKSAWGGTDPLFVIPSTVTYPKALYVFMFISIVVIAMSSPVISAALILSLFDNISDAIRYFFRRHQRQRVFNSLCEASLELAEKLHGKYPRDVIIFCNTSSDYDPKLRDRVHHIRAIPVAKSEHELFIPHEIHFYCLSNDPVVDIGSAMTLLEKFGHKNNLWINLFTDVSQNSSLLESISQENTEANLMVIDSIQITSYDLLDRYPLYQSIRDGVLNVMILGLGSLGVNILKAVIACGQLSGVSLQIWCIDQDAFGKQKLIEHSYPELTGSRDGKSGNYNINYVSLDIRSTDFTDFLDSLEQKPGWAAITTEDDNLNASTAVALYARYSELPFFRVLSRVNNSLMLNEFRSTLKRGCKKMIQEICFFSSNSNFEACDFLYSSDLSRMALNVDLCYGQILDHEMYEKSGMTIPEETARTKEISRFYHSYRESSSLASALGIRYKLFQAGVQLPSLEDGSAAPLTKEQADMYLNALKVDSGLLLRLTQNEHDRWMAFIRSDGYRVCLIDEIRRNYRDTPAWKGKNMITKTHPFLVPWDSLDELDQQIIAVCGDDPTSKAKDEIIVDNISRIISLDYRMEVNQNE